MEKKIKSIPIISGEYQVKILDIFTKDKSTSDEEQVINYTFKLSVKDGNIWRKLYATEFYESGNKNCTLYKMAKKTLSYYPDLQRFNPHHFIGKTLIMRLTVSKKRDGNEFLHILYFKPLNNTDENTEENNNE